MKKMLIGLASLAGVLCVFADPILPGETAAATRQEIQAAIDAAAVANPVGTVTLGNGTFNIDAQLMVTGGVTLVGQGWENTIIKQTATNPTAETRCVVVKDGAKVEHVTLTGARVAGPNSTFGGGALVHDGTISWCCITNNSISTANSKYGGGVYIAKGSIDHSIIVDNIVSSQYGTCGGGGIGVYQPTGEILIDTCLIAGNAQSNGQGGAGFFASFLNNHYRLTVRNTTIIGNEASGTGGGVYVAEHYSANQYSFALVNSILADNTSGSEGADANIYLPSDERIVSGYVAQSSNNLFANGTAALGADSTSIAGSGTDWFADAAGGDYHLSANSLPVSAGIAYTGIGVDLDNVAFADPPAIGCYELSERASEPVFNPASGSSFYPTTSVTLSCETAGAALYYTTDGSTPTESSAPYTGSIAISETKTIKARAYKTGMRPSAIALATYICRPQPADFKKSVEITLSTNLAATAITTGIPALVKLSESTITGFDYSDFSLANGGDMMFVDDGSGAVLPHEVDTWNTSGESLVWVKLPSTEEDTKIVLYYGKGTLSTEAPADVWSDYVGVWHFEEATAASAANSHGTYANSTATTGIDGNVAQYAVTNETGRFGKCFRVNDSTGQQAGNYAYGGVWVNDSGSNSPIDGGQNFTISGWFKHGHFNYYWDHMFYKREKSDNTGSQVNAFAIECNIGTGSDPQIRPRGSSGVGDVLLKENQGLYDKWGYVTFVYDGVKCYLYENGELKGSSTIAYCKDNDSPLVFGNNCNVASGQIGDAAWNGWIDEVRYSSGSKSADWVAAEYAAMNVGETDIFTYGDAKSTKARSGVIIIVE